MKKIILLFALSLTSLISFSQHINGMVLDKETNKPLEGVHVYINTTDIGTLTNDKGTFYLKLPPNIRKKDVICFSYVGYKTLEIPYSKIKNKHQIYLNRNIINITEIKLSQKRKLNTKLPYTKLASMKIGLHSFGSILNDNKIYVVGGDASFEINGFQQTMAESSNMSFKELLKKASSNYSNHTYKANLLTYDIDLNKWEIDKLKFRKRAYHNLNYYNNKIYVLGGKWVSANGRFEYLDDKIEVFDKNSRNVEIDDTNPHQAVNFASFTYDNFMIVMGGSVKIKRNGTKKYSNKVHMYNMQTGLWYELENMTKAKEVNGILLGDKIYLIGGFNNNPLSDIESFDLISGKWEKIGDIFNSISKPGITQNNNILYFFDNGKMYTYDTKTKKLDEYSIDLFLNASKLFCADNKLYILGGYEKEEFSSLASKRLYSIDLNEFEKTKVNKSKIL
ncbi:MAG: hypothetical protein B6I20_11470 [Bacteroidetes bacterium 4572_117]|nr:MAG: hypothetical protein B6I20_11470 [Bacteroidetes bacterium 4572_117]